MNKRRTPPPVRKGKNLSWISILLVLTASIGLVSSAMWGILPGFQGGIYWHSPTSTFQGYLSVNYTGIYGQVSARRLCRLSFPPCLAPDEDVFYLNTGNGTVRLVFYCRSITNLMTTVYGYCSNASQLPFGGGACLYVKGTLIVPSEWPTSQFTPALSFTGDLYVFQYEPLATCA
jgi:hypothetical protein